MDGFPVKLKSNHVGKFELVEQGRHTRAEADFGAMGHGGEIETHEELSVIGDRHRGAEELDLSFYLY